MNYLFIHPNFPGQHKYLIRDLASDPNNDVRFICNPKLIDVPGVKKIIVRHPEKRNRNTHRYLRDIEAHVYRGQAIARVCMQLQKSGFTPDVIWVHPGWGDALFVKDIYPTVPLICYAEFYYHAFGADLHFDPSQPPDMDLVAQTRIRNTHLLLSLEACDAAVAPTQWQFQLQPEEYKHKVSVIHEGIDCEVVSPKSGGRVAVSDQLTLSETDEVVTYIARNLETYRGFPSFMKAMAILLKQRPNTHVIVIGSDGVSYGSSKDRQLRHRLMMELQLPTDRMHFLGKVPYQKMIDCLRLSKAHIYLTYPFVLSWSMLEAMAAGCIVIGSKTKPVEEVIEDGKNGFLVDFFSPDDIAQKTAWALDHQSDCADIRVAARQTILNGYDLKVKLDMHKAYFAKIASGNFGH